MHSCLIIIVLHIKVQIREQIPKKAIPNKATFGNFQTILDYFYSKS